MRQGDGSFSDVLMGDVSVTEKFGLSESNVSILSAYKAYPFYIYLVSPRVAMLIKWQIWKT